MTLESRKRSPQTRSQLAYAALEFAVVGDGRGEGDFGGGDGRDAARDELGGVDEEARGDAFFEAVAAQVSHLVADLHEVARRRLFDAAFARDDLGFEFGGRVVEFERDEALARRLFEV